MDCCRSGDDAISARHSLSLTVRRAAVEDLRDLLPTLGESGDTDTAERFLTDLNLFKGGHLRHADGRLYVHRPDRGVWTVDSGAITRQGVPPDYVGYVRNVGGMRSSRHARARFRDPAVRWHVGPDRLAQMRAELAAWADAAAEPEPDDAPPF